MNKPRTPRRPRTANQVKSFNPRQSGTQVSYSQQQTDRYRSLASRLEKARSLVGKIQEIPGVGTRMLYRFPSTRSPDGGWIVIVDESAPPRPVPTFPDPPGDPPTGGGGGGLPTTSTVFAVDLGGVLPLPAQILSAQGNPAYSGPVSFPYRLPWLRNTVFAPGVTLSNTVTAINAVRLIAPFTPAGQPILTAGYWVSNGKIYNFVGGSSAIVLLFRYVPEPGGLVPNAYQFNPALREFRWNHIPGTWSITGLPPNVTAYPVGFVPGSPPPVTLPPDPADPPPQDPPLPIDPDRAHYSCNCPDYTRTELQDRDSEYPSRWRDRVWTDSKAGAPVDDGNAYCKHVLATMIKRGDPLPSIGT